MTLEEFDALPEAEARERLAACLDVPRWVDTVLDGRPYADVEALRTVAEVAAGSMSDEELASALAAHPRIGERVSLRDASSLGSSGQATGSTDGGSGFSDKEQSAVDAGDVDVAARLAEGNRAYEDRFDRVFLVRAAGRDADEILAELTRRLGNDPHSERAETITALREIALLRLGQVVG